MKKLFAIAIAAICLMATTTSCKKESVIVDRYGFDTTELRALQYVTGHDDEAQNFINDLNAVTNKFDGIEFTQSEIVAACDAVVAKYNNKYIRGTFSLYRIDVDTQEKLSTVKT